MADQLNMNGLSLADSQHAHGGGMGGGRSTYIPPHMRGVPPAVDGPPPPVMNGSAANVGWNGARSAQKTLLKPTFGKCLIHSSAMTSATVPALHINGPVHRILPPEPTVLLQHHSIPGLGMHRSVTIELSTPTHTVSQEVLIPVED